MPPPHNQKRVKGTQVYRPFIYGTTAQPFDPVKNPKPEGTPADHTHSWTVFVKGVEGQDITYWLQKVQFKLHDSIPNPLRMVEAAPGQPFTVSETGWGEFEVTIKLHYVPEAYEKAQTLYHHLCLHPFGSEENKAKQRDGEVTSWSYEEQIFNEPYDQFYDILTGGTGDAWRPNAKTKGGKKTSQKELDKRTATIPPRPSPGQPYSRETEVSELRKLREAEQKVEEMKKVALKDVAKKQAQLEQLKASSADVKVK